MVHKPVFLAHVPSLALALPQPPAWRDDYSTLGGL